MKKLVITSLLVVLLVSIVSVIAQEEIPSPGITPDSWLYGLDRAIESLQKAIAFAPEARAKLALQLAAERLAEAKEMDRKGKPDLARTTTEDYGEEMGEAKRYGEAIAEVAKQKDVKEVISRATSIHLIVLKEVNPDKPLYPAKRKAEDVGIDTVPTPEEKAKRQLNAAGNRSAEAKAMADKGKSDLAKKASEDYDEEIDKAVAYGREIAELAKKKEFDALVARATSIHIDVLERVLEKVPEVAKPAIQRAINASKGGREGSLEDLGETEPGEVAKLRFEHAEKRLNKAKEKADEGDVEEAEDLVEEYEDEVNKSSEMRKKAEDAGKDITELLELVSTSTSKHLQTLQEVYEKVPDAAKSAIEKAMNVSAKGQEMALEALQKVKPETAEEIETGMPEDVKAIRKRIGRPENITTTETPE